MERHFETHHDLFKPGKTWQEQVMSVTATAVFVLMVLSAAVFAL